MRKPIIIAVLSLSGFISSLTGADEILLQDNPPQQYVVVKGDTLWSIASRFLKDPWQWPTVWKMNREQIKNPNRIYPGDMVVLDTSGDQPTLRLVQGEQGTERLAPRARSEAIEAHAIPPIPPSAIGPFLSQPLVADADAMDHSPYIVGMEDSRLIMGLGDRVYASGAMNPDIANWSIYRPGKNLVDPDTQETLGREAEYLGEARTLANGEVTSVEIVRSTQEIRRDDRLTPSSENRVQYVPHAPEMAVSGQIISAYGSDVSDVGQYATVVINRGSQNGLEVGHVLAVYRKGRTVPATAGEPRKNAWRYVDTDCLKPGAKVSFDQFYDPKETFQPCANDGAKKEEAWRYSDIGCLKPGAKVSFDQFFNPKDVYRVHCRAQQRDAITLPNARTGLVFVYRVFDRVSYALVMNVNRPVYLLDVVTNP